MMEAIQNWKGDDLSFLLILWNRRSPVWNLLSNPLMWPRSIEIPHVFSDHPIQLLFPKDQDVIEAFSPDTAQEAFTDCIRLGRTLRRCQNFNGRADGNPCKSVVLVQTGLPRAVAEPPMRLSVNASRQNAPLAVKPAQR